MNKFNSLHESRIFILLFFLTLASLPGIYTLSASSTGGYRSPFYGYCLTSATLLPEIGSTRVIVRPNQTPYLFVTLNPAPAGTILVDRFNAAPKEAAKPDLSLQTAFSTLHFVLYVYRHNSCGDNKDTCLRAKTENQANITAESLLKVLYLLSIPE